ncbi:MAG: hypothetical protein A2901_07910 [Elusimicrobia bacterium RIFCSPLOWO2_01_FULL_54_10]|nr:MAG: hypothetical protein A2901_07910 [Elusimicrobia bacterium RIFCSPLOWO2_01_FULL_54_10]
MKPFLDTLGSIFRRRWILLGIIPVWVVPFSLLKTLGDDGMEVFFAQKTALVLEVHARTDLAPDIYPLLEESLLALDGVKQVIAASPEESLKKVAEDTSLGIDSAWLLKKKEDLQGKDTLLPWSYTVHPDGWTDDFVSALTGRILALEVGEDKVRPVAEVRSDRERAALAYALFNYSRWIRRTLVLMLGLGLVSGAVLAMKIGWKFKDEEGWAHKIAGIFFLALLGGLLSHVLYIAILSYSFFPETSGWMLHLGRSLPFQLALSVLFSFFAHGALFLERRR